MARLRARRLGTALLGLLAAAAPAAAGPVEGRLAIDIPGLRLADVAPVVVYLERIGAAAAPADAEGPPAVIRQREARFAPGFLAVARDQPVVMPNDDDIYHNVFSFSAPNDFDLGLYPAGQSRTVRFEHPGAVRIYCSIHESMNATLFVAPTPWFAVADAEGRFAIADVPAGRWRLRTWAESLPPTEQTLRVGAARLAVEVHLAGSAGDASRRPADEAQEEPASRSQRSSDSAGMGLANR